MMIGLQQFSLGDRVVYSHVGCLVPFGTMGIVVGIDGDYVDVVFATNFAPGLSDEERYAHAQIDDAFYLIFSSIIM
jgi:hypothetical protein